MKPIGIFSAASLFVLAACTTSPGPMPPGPGPFPPGPPRPPGPPAAMCDERPVQWAIGERAGASVLERVTLESGSQSARIVRPGEAVTMEFNPTRITIQVSGNGRILDLRCG